MEYILRTHQLTKQYGKKAVVDAVNLSIRPGEIYGFLGQNGAGKTTTIRMIMSLIAPTSGYVELFGEKRSHNNYRLFERIGSIIEFPGFYHNLNAVENLEIHRRLMGVPGKDCIEETLAMVDLLDNRNLPFGKYSLGMKQRLGLARALLHGPELLVLDEPTNGLDPHGIKETRKLLLGLVQQRNITILISSHILSEVQQLATKIGIIHKGKLLEEVDFDTLQKKNRHYIEMRISDDRKSTLLLEQRLQVYDYQINEPGVLRIFERLDDSADINRVFVQNGMGVSTITLMRESLEDYFIRLTGGEENV